MKDEDYAIDLPVNVRRPARRALAATGSRQDWSRGLGVTSITVSGEPL
jgi:hypothetical protein